MMSGLETRHRAPLSLPAPFIRLGIIGAVVGLAFVMGVAGLHQMIVHIADASPDGRIASVGRGAASVIAAEPQHMRAVRNPPKRLPEPHHATHEQDAGVMVFDYLCFCRIENQNG
jgi:hypothetical protein